MSKYLFAGQSDIGIDREAQEDFVEYKDFGDELLVVIADGTGSVPNYVQPASLVVMDIIDSISDIYDEKKDLLLSEPEFFLKRAMMESNRMLASFKMGNEERYSGYAASVTCCFATADQRFHVAHSGNTRLYLMRNGQLKQLTKDQTQAERLLEEGTIDADAYHTHPDRLKLTGGLTGLFDRDLKIDTFTGKFKEGDVILMTTDGIHYALTTDNMLTFILSGGTVESAAAALIDAAKNVVKYPDNMTAALVWNPPSQPQQNV